jgi:hypothetical protein
MRERRCTIAPANELRSHDDKDLMPPGFEDGRNCRGLNWCRSNRSHSSVPGRKTFRVLFPSIPCFVRRELLWNLS